LRWQGEVVVGCVQEWGGKRVAVPLVKSCHHLLSLLSLSLPPYPLPCPPLPPCHCFSPCGIHAQNATRTKHNGGANERPIFDIDGTRTHEREVDGWLQKISNKK
jgi:hypothetical protein